MNKLATITAEIGTDALAILDERARARGISSAEFAAVAIRRVAEGESDLNTFVKMGEASIARGGDVKHDDFMAQLRTWRETSIRATG